jgi:3' terminal RNA ribose 2'-O-methyltransferase Hen1
MLLTISYSEKTAADLGYLLHKSPFRVHSFDQVFGKAHIFYRETSTDHCTAALLLEIDPIGLVRNRRGPSGEAHALEEYVNDRTYAASSFLSVAIARTFGTAITGKSKERQELADTPLPMEARITVLPCRGGENLLRHFFEPLGYEVSATRHPLDEKFPEWGESPYFSVGLKATIRLSDLLTHLENLERLRSRSVSAKHSLALRELALGVEALERFVRQEPLRRVHECVFGFESEPVDPRL